MSEPAPESMADSASGVAAQTTSETKHAPAENLTADSGGLMSPLDSKDANAANSDTTGQPDGNNSSPPAAEDNNEDPKDEKAKDSPDPASKASSSVPDSDGDKKKDGKEADEAETSTEMKRSNEDDTTGQEPVNKKPKVEGENGEEELSPLEKAKIAAEKARITMLPELDPVDPEASNAGLPKHQHKYALSAIRAIKRLKDAQPFVSPVDPVRQGVPHYFDYIKNPMDLGTMEKKLVEGQYHTIKAIVDDFNLIVSNCIIFNGEDALISKMALSIAQSFKKQLSNMPTFDASRKGSQAAAAAASASSSANAASAATPAAKAPAHTSSGAEDEGAINDDHVGKRSSTTTTVMGPNGLPTLRRKSTIDGRPKREIRPPRQPGSYVGSGTGEGRPRNKKYASELRFAGQVLREMQSRKLENISFPFLQPVDPIEQGVPTYFDIIKEPMDLSTIQKKLAEGIYYNADEFESDIRLMFRNCYTFNPEGTPVNVMGHKLEAYFDSRWVDKPVPGGHIVEESDVSDVDEEYAESGMVNPAIDVLEEQLKLIKKQLKRLKKDALADYYKRGHRRSTAPKRRRSSNHGGSGSGGASSATSKPLPTEMTYEMKRELRDKIDKLPEKKIRTVIAIIQESMPDLGNNGQEEIELEVDALDTTTLLRLYNYAVLGRREGPEKAHSGSSGAASSPSFSGSGSGFNGGSEFDVSGHSGKRRSKALSEEEHVRKIAEIESKLKEFDNAASPSNGGTAAAAGSAASTAAAAESDSSDDDQFESDDSSSEEE